jgi:UPF0716 protein FxsA
MGAIGTHIAAMPFALAFLVFVFAEIVTFVAVANAMRVLGMFALLLASMALGVFIIRLIGITAIRRLQERTHAGEAIGQELGGLVLGFLGGVLLIIPGFLSSALGLVLLVKPIQSVLWPRYGSRVAGRMSGVRTPGQRPPGAAAQWRTPNQAPNQTLDTSRQGVIIDAESTSSDEARQRAQEAKESPFGSPSATRGPGRAGKNPWAD